MREFYTLALLILTALATSAQNLDLEKRTKLKQKKPIKVSGSTSASVTCMDRDPHLGAEALPLPAQWHSQSHSIRIVAPPTKLLPKQ